MEYYNVEEQTHNTHRLEAKDDAVTFFKKFYGCYDDISVSKYSKTIQHGYQNRRFHNDGLSTKSTSPLDLSRGENSKRDSSSSLSYVEEHKGGEGKKSHFVERQGDWICMRCKNLNFSFRIVCNRCKISKVESEMLYEGHMQNIFNIIKYNELVQNQMMNNNIMPFQFNPPVGKTSFVAAQD